MKLQMRLESLTGQHTEKEEHVARAVELQRAHEEARKQSEGKFLLIYICNFHVLSNLLLIYICKLHWNLNTIFVCQVIIF